MEDIRILRKLNDGSSFFLFAALMKTHFSPFKRHFVVCCWDRRKKGKQVVSRMVEIYRSKRFISSFMCFCCCQAAGNVERSSIFLDVCSFIVGVESMKFQGWREEYKRNLRDFASFHSIEIY